MNAVRNHSAIQLPNLSEQQRYEMRDKIMLRVLPYCLMQFAGENLNEHAKRAAEAAYTIADATLAARSYAYTS